MEEEDDIKEEIVEDIDNDLVGLPGQGGKQFAGGEVDGIGASTSLGIDQSIDTLRLDEYDYIEEVKFY